MARLMILGLNALGWLADLWYGDNCRPRSQCPSAR
jgi:hypothetical protein